VNAVYVNIITCSKTGQKQIIRYQESERGLIDFFSCFI